MRRILVTACAVVLSAAALAAVAYAATKDFGGPIQGRGTMSFAGVRSGGKFTKAGEFLVNKIPLNCAQGGSTRGTFSTSNFVNVSSERRFGYTFNFGPGEIVRVTGRFNAAGDKASGTVNASGVDFPTRTNCTTNGARNWRAETW